MILPRLRVRELLFLVVYAALIGQAFGFSLVGAKYQVDCSHPSNFAGYAWVKASEVPVHVPGPDGKYHYYASALEIHETWKIDVRYESLSPVRKALLAYRFRLVETDLADVLHVLAPEDLLVVTQEDQE